jgi:hypothetical protein
MVDSPPAGVFASLALVELVAAGLDMSRVELRSRVGHLRAVGFRGCLSVEFYQSVCPAMIPMSPAELSLKVVVRGRDW